MLPQVHKTAMDVEKYVRRSIVDFVIDLSSLPRSTKYVKFHNMHELTFDNFDLHNGFQE